MKTVFLEGEERTIPDIICVDQTNEPIFEITEGEFIGVQFQLKNIKVDENEEDLLNYDLYTSMEECHHNYKMITPIVNNFLLSALYDQIERAQNEASKASDSDT